MDVDAIVQLAENLSGQYRAARGAGGDPEVAFNDCEVPLAEGDFGSAFEGLLRFESGEFQVFINSVSGRVSDGRRRFTIAHELGHYSIQAHRDGIRSGQLVHRSETGFHSIKRIEREADIFAAHFLIPTAELKARFRGRAWGAADILEVHRHFRTSVECAALRCQAALPGNSTLIRWEEGRVSWQRMNRDWWFDLPAKSIRTASRLARGSATDRLLRGVEVSENGYLSNGTTRSQWFPRVADWSNDNDVLIEEAISLGSFGVLTLLRPDTCGVPITS